MGAVSVNQKIDGTEAIWNGNPPSASVLAIINSSSILVNSIYAYDSAIQAGSAAPIVLYVNPETGDPLTNGKQTIVNGNNEVQIQIGGGIPSVDSNAGNYVSALTQELGKFAYFNQGQLLYNEMANLNPNDPNFKATAGAFGETVESWSAAYSFLVRQQTGPVFTIDGDGSTHANGAILQTLQSAWDSQNLASASPENAFSALSTAAYSVINSFPAVNGLNYFSEYSNNAAALQGEYSRAHLGEIVTNSPNDIPGLVSNDANGNIAFTTLPAAVTFSSGSGGQEALGFSNSQLSSAAYKDANGNIVSNIAYVHNSDGSYSATMTDATGALVSTQQFSSDGSEVETVTNISTPVNVNASGVTLTTNATTIDVNGADYDTTILNGNHVINAQAGDTFQLTGVGYNVNLSATGAASTVTFNANSGGTVNGSGATVDAAGSDSVTVNGSNNGISESTGDYVVATGGGNVIDAVAGAQAYITGTNGNFDTIDGNGDALGSKTANGQPTGILLSTNAQVNVNGSGDGIAEAAGDSVGVYGGGNSINVTAGTYTAIGNTNGNFDTINGSSVAWGVTTANGQSTGIGLNANSQVNVNGSGDGVNEAAGDSVGVYGGGNSINVAAGALTVVGDTNGNFDTLNGSDDALGGKTANGQDTGIGLNINSQVNVNGSGDGINEAAGDSVGVYGGGNTIGAVAGTYTAIGNTNGNFDTINGSSDAWGGSTANGQGTGITLNGNSQANVNGSGDDVNEGAGDSLGIYGGGNSINTTAGALTVVGDTNGNFDTINGSGDALGGTTANGQGTGIGLSTNSQVNVNGNGDGVNEAAGDSVGIYGGGNTINTVAGALTVVGDTNGDFDTIYASGDSFGGKTANGQDTGIGIDANSQASVYGSNDGISLDGGNTVNIDGQQDQIDGNGNTIDFSGSTAGDIVTGSDDSGSDWSGVDYVDDGSSSGGDDGGGGDLPPPDDGGDDGDPGVSAGFAGNRQTINAELGQGAAQLAQLEQSQGLNATAVKQGLAQATEMSTDATTSAGNSANVLEGARWNDPTVTWSMGTTNGAFDQTEQRQIEQAFATWAAASGLQFVEVSSPSQADISIGWGNLDTSQTGAVGLTTYRSSKGVFSAGTQIQLESSTQDALTPGAHGELTYSGTDATFSQTVLHEIGHALGLAENADTTSIMNYDLTSSNQTLDQTDLNGIQALYGSSAQTAALIQAMAGHASSSPASITSIASAEQASQHVQLIAGAH